MKKVLVAYYSQSGHTAKLAHQIAAAADADLHQVTVGQDAYPADMYATDDVFKQQLNTQHFPQLTSHLPNPAQYDLLLVGGPVWDQRVSGPVISFLQQINGFTGRVADFSSAYSATGNYEQDFCQLADNAGLKIAGSGLHINGSQAEELILQRWLSQFS